MIDLRDSQHAVTVSISRRLQQYVDERVLAFVRLEALRGQRCHQLIARKATVAVSIERLELLSSCLLYTSPSPRDS